MPDHVWPNVLLFEWRRGSFELEDVSSESLPESLPGGKSFSGSGEEEEVFVAGSRLGSSLVEVDVEHGGGGVPEGTDSGFAPFASEGDLRGRFESKLVKSDSDGFGDATPGVVHEAEHDGVSKAELGGGVDLTKEELQLVRFEIVDEGLRVSLEGKSEELSCEGFVVWREEGEGFGKGAYGAEAEVAGAYGDAFLGFEIVEEAEDVFWRNITDQDLTEGPVVELRLKVRDKLLEGLLVSVDGVLGESAVFGKRLGKEVLKCVFEVFKVHR